MKSGLKAAGFIAIFILGCDIASYDYLLETHKTYTWPTRDIAKINADSENGNISVTSGPDDSVTAVVTINCTGENQNDASNHLDDIVIEGMVMGDEIFVGADTPESDKRDYSAHFDITAPDYLELELITSNGDVSTKDMTGEMTVSTLDGDIETVFPANASFQFDAWASDGSVAISGYDSIVLSVDDSSHKTGVVGQGGVAVTLSAINGNVTIRSE